MCGVVVKCTEEGIYVLDSVQDDKGSACHQRRKNLAPSAQVVQCSGNDKYGVAAVSVCVDQVLRVCNNGMLGYYDGLGLARGSCCPEVEVRCPGFAQQGYGQWCRAAHAMVQFGVSDDCAVRGYYCRLAWGLRCAFMDVVEDGHFFFLTISTIESMLRKLRGVTSSCVRGTL